MSLQPAQAETAHVAERHRRGWRSRGRTSDAIHRLAPLYKTFSADDTVPDLRKARELLLSA